MAIFKDTLDIRTTRSFLNQLIDVIQEDISSSVSRRKYQAFVTGGIGPGVTSSLFQTVYDQDFTLQTANPVFDITVGLAAPDSLLPAGTANSAGIAGVSSGGNVTSQGKYLYPSCSLMMREKTDIYGQFAQTLLGDRKTMFTLPQSVSTPGGSPQEIDAALFVAFKRLFSRDQIKRETFAMRFYQSASFVSTTTDGAVGNPNIDCPPVNSLNGVSNLYVTSITGSSIYTDIGASESRFFSQGGEYGFLVDAATPDKAVGLLYYGSGIAVLDIEKIISGSQYVSGVISSMNPLGQQVIGPVFDGVTTVNKSKFVPDLLVSGSVDDIIDHFCYSRFGSGSLTAATFQNVTNINSSLIFCRAQPDDFNYSSNPTYLGADGKLTILDSTLSDLDNQEVFTYITTIGLYDDTEQLVAVAKLSRPVEKNPGRDLTFRVRLDF